MDDADAIIRRLGLRPHPEGGHFAEVHRDRPPDGGRGAVTSIHFLLRAGEVSHWHRVTDATEIWYHHAGGPLELAISTDSRSIETVRLGSDLAAGERPQAVVPADAWQSARPLGDWTLVGCAVAPAFEFSSFVLAPPGWRPGEP